jgi:hypothetical protein
MERLAKEGARNLRGNRGLFAITLFTRYLGWECGLVSSKVRVSSGVYWSHQPKAYARKKRCNTDGRNPLFLNVKNCEPNEP